MNNKDLAVWVVLISLTLIGFFSAESSLGKNVIVPVLLLLTGIKFLGVGFQFMELKKAHAFWQWGFVAVFFLFSCLVWFLV
ncbi:MAG: hypothetical protein DWQ02_13600 [Bacteroidetes bacterium]|nr:MAG: hypothetical protein DWQ02_13600 [Bacteroidota bacterium]